MANANPILDPNDAFTGIATGAAVVGARVLKIAGAKTDGNPVPVAHCGAADVPAGFSGSDTAENAAVTCYRFQVLQVEAGGTVTAGSAVEVMANGKIQNLASGTAVGVAWESASNGGFPLIQPALSGVPGATGATGPQGAQGAQGAAG